MSQTSKMVSVEGTKAVPVRRGLPVDWSRLDCHVEGRDLPRCPGPKRPPELLQQCSAVDRTRRPAKTIGSSADRLISVSGPEAATVTDPARRWARMAALRPQACATGPQLVT
jgi:hypothetical protein